MLVLQPHITTLTSFMIKCEVCANDATISGGTSEKAAVEWRVHGWRPVVDHQVFGDTRFRILCPVCTAAVKKRLKARGQRLEICNAEVV